MNIDEHRCKCFKPTNESRIYGLEAFALKKTSTFQTFDIACASIRISNTWRNIDHAGLKPTMI